MRTLDITYQNEYGHKAGVSIEAHGSYDDVIFLTGWDWWPGQGSVESLAVIRKADIPKLIAFLQAVEVD